ncbi:MAG: hypothetical protein ACE5G0_10595 [Rhodothermales bacterium]
MWSSMEEKIRLYSQLSSEERADVEGYVEQHPEMASLLEEAKAFGALLQEARLLHADPPSDEALAYYVATRSITDRPLPASLHAAFDRIEARLANDPPLRARCEAIEHRMAALEAASDPAAQFEHLTGHTLHPVFEEASLSAPVAAGPVRPAGDRKPTQRLIRRLARWPVAAVIAVSLVVFGVLSIAGPLSQSEVERLAHAELSNIEATDLNLRSGAASSDRASSQALYQQSIPLLRKARAYTLGFIPGFDQAALIQATELLTRVVEQESDDSPLRSEANYLLAVVYMAQEDVAGAQARLQAVIAGSGWREAEATALHDALLTLSE